METYDGSSSYKSPRRTAICYLLCLGALVGKQVDVSI